MVLTATETGQDRLSLKWRSEGEPDEPLTTVLACARDFKRLFPEAADRDAVAAFTAVAPSWEAAIDRACRSRGANGKMNNHQSRVPLATLLEFRGRIKRAIWDVGTLLVISNKEGKRWLYSFDILHDWLEEIAASLPGIGPVTTYDVAWRLACWLGIEPTSLYLHAGVTSGARAMGFPVRGRKRLKYAELVGHLGEEVMDVLGDVNTLEDFSCCYRRVIELIPSCPDCGYLMRLDITREWRCISCDDAIDRMMMDQWEDDVAEGEHEQE